MKILPAAVVLALVAQIAPQPSAAQSHWTAAGNAALSFGDQTETSLAWWASFHRWLGTSRALGLEAGRFRWEGRRHYSFVRAETSPLLPNFSGLARGSNELQFLSVSARVRSVRADDNSGPFVSLGIGGYRQVVREPLVADDSRDGKVRPGGSIAFGASATRGFAPSAQFRYDWVDTRPEPSNYFSAAMGLQFDR